LADVGTTINAGCATTAAVRSCGQLASNAAYFVTVVLYFAEASTVVVVGVFSLASTIFRCATFAQATIVEHGPTGSEARLF